MECRNTGCMTIGARIKAARKVRDKMSRPALSALSGVKYPTLAGIENDDQASSTLLPDIAKALKVHLEWLRTGKGPRDLAAPADEDGPFATILAFSAAVGLGDGEEADEYATTHGLKFRNDSLRRKGLLGANIAVLYGKGDSMQPVISTGDAVLFNKDDTTPKHEQLYVVQLPGVNQNDQISVKQAELIGDIVTFRALNPEGDHHWRRPRLMQDARNPITVVGKVCWLGKWT